MRAAVKTTKINHFQAIKIILVLLCRKEEKGGQLKGAGDAQIFIS